MNDPLTDQDIEAATGRAKALLESHVHDDPTAHGQKEHIDDEAPGGDATPPPGWKRDANGNWGPPGWVKRGDTWDGPLP